MRGSATTQGPEELAIMREGTQEPQEKKIARRGRKNPKSVVPCWKGWWWRQWRGRKNPKDVLCLLKGMVMRTMRMYAKTFGIKCLGLVQFKHENVSSEYSCSCSCCCCAARKNNCSRQKKAAAGRKTKGRASSKTTPQNFLTCRLKS